MEWEFLGDQLSVLGIAQLAAQDMGSVTPDVGSSLEGLYQIRLHLAAQRQLVHVGGMQARQPGIE